MRTLVTLGVLLVSALFVVACGEDGGDTTVIRESQDSEAEEAAAKAQDEVEELEAKLEKQQEQAQQQQTVAASEPEPEPAPEPESAEPAPTGAPDVVGQRLDIAKAQLRSAGYSARVSGGGLFGVVVDRNWVVCAQEPPSGDKVDINVDRSC